ncbi:MAG: glycoside hydrolase family 88 protein [Gorillibacterium sp.]|nr:glycoside hydrolase family 88 protein [Gorillibacterium sp.]
MKQDHLGEWGMDINKWDWVPGVGVIAMLEYYDATKNPEILTYLVEWVKQNKHQAEGKRVINSIAPYAIFPALHRLTGEAWFREEAVRVAEWLVKEAPRTREQAFEHTVTENAEFSEQVWADTIFMAVLFLARTASLVSSKSYAEEALQQVLIHLRLLQDDKSGVLFHGWNCNSGNHMSSARWTRANAWLAAGIPLILTELAPLVEIPDEFAERYNRLIAGLLSYQQADGLWSTVMDHSDYYHEISGSAGIGYGIWKAQEVGLLAHTGTLDKDKTAAERVLHAILPYITEAGVVQGVSGGTPVMESIEVYNLIPTFPTQYGQGLVLMLLSEALRREGESHE